MTTASVANRLVQLCNAGKGDQAMKDLYAKDIVSIEAQGTPVLIVVGCPRVRQVGQRYGSSMATDSTRWRRLAT